MLTWLDADTPLPPTSRALGPDSDAPGLLAAGGTLSAARLEEAYRHGVFPWYGPNQPILWWSPEPRMVLHVAEFHLPTSLKKTLRRFVRTPGCEIRIDSAFRRVIEACAGTPREGQDGTWIVPAMVEAYVAFARTHGITQIDCQQNTHHLARFGAREVDRPAFERHLARACGEPDIADWTYDPAMWGRVDPALAPNPDA